jgi:hypothetical protein
MNQDTVRQTHRSAPPTPAHRQASSRASCSPPGLDARWRIGGELHLNAVMEKRDGEARHRVMFDAGHLTLECESAMVMDEQLVKPAFCQASTTPMPRSRMSFRNHDRFPTVHQLAMLNSGTADTVSKLPLSGTHHNPLIPRDQSLVCPLQPRPYTV